MKQIQYVMTDRSGEVRTFRIKTIPQDESSDVLYELFCPEQLRGNAAARLDKLSARGFSLSNWHVIETKDEKI